MPDPIGPDDTTPGRDIAFALFPCVQRPCYVRGVPSLQTLVEIQPAGAYFGAQLAPQYLERDAAMDFDRMRSAAAHDELNLVIWSGWRDHEHQARLWQEWEQGKRRLRPARPGHSLHESGKAADILRSHDAPDRDGTEIGPTDRWLAAHAHLFGFHRTVPMEKWHFEHRR